MRGDRLDLLFLSPMAPSPATIGAQRRIEGLMAAMARRHRVAGLALVGTDQDPEAAARAMRAYCDEVVLVPQGRGEGLGKRLRQLRSLASAQSFERQHLTVPELQVELDRMLRARAYDAVVVEFPYLAHYRLRQAPPGRPSPLVVLDAHNIEHDVARQSLDASRGVLRRLHLAANWRKLAREELDAWRAADGVAFTSVDDAERARALHPAIRAALVPNAVDIGHFRPRADLPPPDGCTLVFFGTMRYFPNLDGVRWLLGEIWPRVERTHPRARLKLIGHTTPEIRQRAGPGIEVTGLVDDVRPHLAQAAAVIVPLRVGGGTRFKILEAMAMGRPVLSTTLGAEGIAAAAGRDILIADGAEDFASAAGRLLDDAALRARLGASARGLVERHYSWTAAGERLESLINGLLARPSEAAALI